METISEATKKSKAMLTSLILLMSFLGVFPLDVILPSFTALSTHLNTSLNHIAISLSLFILIVAASQLIIGPLSDHIGRKKLLILGLITSAAGSVGCIFSNDYESFTLFRVLQAIGCGCFVLTQPLIQDMFNGKQRNSARILQISASGLFISLSPLLGSLLQEVFNWHGSFVVFATLTIATILISHILIKSDTPKSKEKISIFKCYGLLLKDRSYISYSTLSALSFACHFSFIVLSPLLFMGKLGLSSYEYSLLFTFYGAAYVIGGVIAGIANRHFSPLFQISSGVGLIGLAGIVLTLWHWSFDISAGSLLIPMIICTTGTSLCRPAATSSALALYPDLAGTAASFLNTIVFATGAAVSGAIVLLESHLPLSLGISVVTIAGVGSLLIYMAKSCNQQNLSDLSRVHERTMLKK